MKRLAQGFAALLIAATPNVALANSIDAVRAEPNPARAGQEVRITVQGDTSESVYCGLLTVFGDGHDQRVAVGGKEGPFPKSVPHIYASPGTFVVKAEGRKVDGRFRCVGTAETRLVIEPALVSTTGPLLASSMDRALVAPHSQPAAKTQERMALPPATTQTDPANPPAAPAEDSGTVPRQAAEPPTRTPDTKSPDAEKSQEELIGLYAVYGVLIGVAGCIIVSVFSALTERWVFYYDRADVWKSLLPWHAIWKSISYNRDTTAGIVTGIARMALSWIGVLLLLGAFLTIFGKSTKRNSAFKAAAQIAVIGIIANGLINGPAVFKRRGWPPP